MKVLGWGLIISGIVLNVVVLMTMPPMSAPLDVLGIILVEAAICGCIILGVEMICPKKS